ncbi:MAG TPA: hypothetical protein VF424_06445 [Vicinamibacterales bacterium]
MKYITALILVVVALTPAVASAQAANLTGQWNATFTMTRPDGQTQSITFTFHFIHKGKTLTGTIGPTPERQWKIEKGVVDGGKVTFQVQQLPDGPLRTFDLKLVKDRLQGNQRLEAKTGQKAEVTVDAARAKSK